MDQGLLVETRDMSDALPCREVVAMEKGAVRERLDYGPSLTY